MRNCLTAGFKGGISQLRLLSLITLSCVKLIQNYSIQCVSIWVCICVFAWVYACVCMCMGAYAYFSVYECVYLCVLVCMYMYVCVLMCLYVCVYTCVYVYFLWAYVFVWMCVYECTYICLCVCMCVWYMGHVHDSVSTCCCSHKWRNPIRTLKGYSVSLCCIVLRQGISMSRSSTFQLGCLTKEFSGFIFLCPSNVWVAFLYSNACLHGFCRLELSSLCL